MLERTIYQYTFFLSTATLEEAVMLPSLNNFICKIGILFTSALW